MPKSLKYSLGIISLTLILGVIVTLKLGYRPAPTKVMGLSLFGSTSELGKMIAKRFYGQLGEEKVIIIGIDNEQTWSNEFLQGLLQTLQEEKRLPQKIYIEKAMSEVFHFDSLQAITGTIEFNGPSLTQTKEVIKASIVNNERVLIVVPHVFSSQLIESGPSHRLTQALLSEQILTAPPLTLSLTSLALHPSEEKSLNPVCVGLEADAPGTADLGCSIIAASRKSYRKQMLNREPRTQTEVVGYMEMPKPNDYLLLVHVPKKSAPQAAH